MPNNLEVVIVVQDEPRDGIQVYAVKDEAEFKQHVRDSLGVEDYRNEDTKDDDIHLGVLYFEEDGMSSVTGHAVQLPFSVNRWCRDCWHGLDDGYSPEVGDTIYFECVARAECDNKEHLDHFEDEGG
jgi:hypothetical protein